MHLVLLHWERTLGSLLLVSSELCPRTLFPFADVSVYLFVVKDLCHEYNYMLSLEPGGGLGDPDTKCH